MVAVAEIMDELLGLPRAERSYLAAKLIESLETDAPFTAEELETFSRRSREIREGIVEPLSLEQLEQKVRAALA